MNDLTFQIIKGWLYTTCPICRTSSPLGSLSLPPNSSEIHFLMVFHMKSIIAFMLLFMAVPTLRIYPTCVFFFSFLKSACIYWVLYARHYSRLLECFNAHNRQKSLPSWNRPPWADAFSCPIASSGNWPHPWRSNSNSCSNQGPSHGDCFFKTLTVFIFTTVHLSTKHFLIANCFMC